VKILVVEDEVKLAKALERGIARAGYAVDVIHDGGKALTRLRNCHEEYDLAVLDVMLPGVDGLHICSRLRDEGVALPILMLTALDGTRDKIQGLDSGADDYVVKPFDFDELLARIRTLLRRPPQVLPQQLAVADLTLEPGSHRVTRGGGQVLLTAKEFALLEYFMRHQGEVLSRDRLLSHAWEYEFDGFSNVVDVHLSNLRKKVDGLGQRKLFHTVRGVGYVLKA
jgi:two-component system copper resistance phosphate regulon response regulator CusR